MSLIPIPFPSSWISSLFSSGKNVPQLVEAPARAFVPGQADLLGTTTEWFNLPKLAALAAAAVAYREWSKRPSQKLSEPMMGCDEKYCPPAYQTFVDRPVNTLLKDQSGGAGLFVPPKKVTLKFPYQKTKMDYFKEASESPGVRLVAHTLA